MKHFLDIDECVADHLLWQSKTTADKAVKGITTLVTDTTTWINQQLDKLEPARAPRPIAATI